MKDGRDIFEKMISEIPEDIHIKFDLSFAISDRIVFLMEEKGLSKKGLADALGKRPSEVTKWLSGQHNFTVSTLAMLSAFFGQPIISVV